MPSFQSVPYVVWYSSPIRIASIVPGSVVKKFAVDVGLPRPRLSLCARARILLRMEEQAPPWRVVDSKIVIESPFFRLRCDQIELPDGTRVADYYVRESRGFAVIFAVTPEDRIVLVRQYKHGIGEVVLELPAGGIDPGEDPATCAARELAEETGYASDPRDFSHLRTFVLDPTGSTSRFHLFLARDARPVAEKNFDLLEDISLELATFEDVRRYVRDGAINVGSQAAAVYYALDVLARL